jgi:hypothetical protein
MRFIPVKEDPDSFFVHEGMDSACGNLSSDDKTNEKKSQNKYFVQA